MVYPLRDVEVLREVLVEEDADVHLSPVVCKGFICSMFISTPIPPRSFSNVKSGKMGT
jgi:hypothetical protein